MRNISLSALTVLPCSPLEQIDAALEAGFDAVSLRVFRVMPTDRDVMADRSLQAAIARRIANTNLQVFDVEVVRLTRDTDVAAAISALDFAGGLGAQWLAVTSDYTSAYDPADERFVVSLLAELCEAAERADMGVMLEFMPYRAIATLEDAVRVAKAVAHPNLGITVDALHFYRSGGTVDDLAAIDPRLLACVQLCDAPRVPPADIQHEARYGRLYPGAGELPLDQLVSAIPPDLMICVEAPSGSSTDASVFERAREAASRTRDVLVLAPADPASQRNA
jgi:sugar phosphate isomerase/epimerase